MWWQEKEWWNPRLQQLIDEIGDKPNNLGIWDYFWREYESSYSLYGIAYIFNVTNLFGKTCEAYVIPPHDVIKEQEKKLDGSKQTSYRVRFGGREYIRLGDGLLEFRKPMNKTTFVSGYKHLEEKE